MTRSRVPVPARGVMVPMVTPMLPDGRVDAESTASLSRHLIDAGVAGLLVLGSTGENGALSRLERRRALSAVVAAAGQDAHVMAGVASLGSSEAAADAAEFASLGADSILLPAPGVFQLSQAELAGHFRMAASAAGIPVLAYEVPGRVQVSLGEDLLIRLLHEEVIVGVKDSSGNMGAARKRAERFRTEGLSPAHFTGSEECIDGFLLGGGSGCVPGLANVVPRLHVELTRLAAAGDWPGAAAMQRQIVSWLDIYFHPLPDGSFMAQVMAALKEALVQMGIIAHSTSSGPFTQADEVLRAHVRKLLDSLPTAPPAG